MLKHTPIGKAEEELQVHGEVLCEKVQTNAQDIIRMVPSPPYILFTDQMDICRRNFVGFDCPNHPKNPIPFFRPQYYTKIVL
jgi:hypothetical protein